MYVVDLQSEYYFSNYDIIANYYCVAKNGVFHNYVDEKVFQNVLETKHCFLRVNVFSVIRDLEKGMKISLQNTLVRLGLFHRQKEKRECHHIRQSIISSALM